jgi:hypothetical protein
MRRRTPFNKLGLLVSFAHQTRQGGELSRIGNFYPSNAHFGSPFLRVLVVAVGLKENFASQPEATRQRFRF